MKAVIMAGGEGRRLKSVTGELPKPMVPLIGKPLMERVIELTLGSGGCRPQPVVPGLTLIRSAELDAEQLSRLLCGACPPFPPDLENFPCHGHTCQVCWQSWLTTGMPPQAETEAGL